MGRGALSSRTGQRAASSPLTSPTAAPLAPWRLTAWRSAAWIADVAMWVVEAAWRLITRTAWGRRIEQSTWAQYAYGMAWTTSAVFIQKLHMHHLGPIDVVGGPATGLTAIVTGPTSGIGRETAAALSRRGARVILACRNVAKGEALKRELEAEAAAAKLSRPALEVRVLDLSSLASVEDFCAAWQAEARPLHILVNNAGIYSMGAPREETCDGFESHMGANHLGHFLLTLRLLPALGRGAAANPWFGARVVNVSSSVHMAAVKGIPRHDPHLRRASDAYSSELAYGQSKLAQVMFTRQLRALLGPGHAVQVFALHPGMVLTDVVRTLPRWMQAAHRVIMGAILLTPAEGARASVYCATSTAAPAEALATEGYFNANCRPMQPSRAARDVDATLWLWQWSARQVGLTRSAVEGLLASVAGLQLSAEQTGNGVKKQD